MRDRLHSPFALCILLAIACAGPSIAMAEDKIEPARLVTYKQVGDVRLDLHVFEPQRDGAGKPAPAIVFFFGGGWTGGTPKQFYPHCRDLAERGMWAAAAEYRIKSKHGTSPLECVKDAMSAVRYLHEHAEELGIDPARIVAGGGSAGGHIAACTGTLEGVQEADEDPGAYVRPAALVLFNPVLDVSDGERFEKRFGEHAARLSPQQHIGEKVPPTVIFHGTADETVPFAQATAFCEAMTAAENACKVVPFEGKPHGFFNYSRNPDIYEITMRETVAFLEKHGILAED